jgi:ribonucleotide monophosphatase NagD (HAD superfamily)
MHYAPAAISTSSARRGSGAAITGRSGSDRGDHPGHQADRRRARFIATNPDPTGPSPAGLEPATGAVAALISRSPRSAPMIGDRMDTGIVAGIEAGLQTILVLSASP